MTENYGSSWTMGASILFLQGDAEARLFASAEETLQACFPGADVEVATVRAGRSDQLDGMEELFARKRDMCIFSVLPDVQGPMVDAKVAARALESVVSKLQEQGTAVAVCNIFRHVKGALSHRAGAGEGLRDRIRAVNLEVMNLSRRTGCFVLDVDSALAHEGGASLGADCFGGDGRAQEIAMEQLVAVVMEALPELLGSAA